MALQFPINVLGEEKRGKHASTAMAFNPSRIRLEAAPANLKGGSDGTTTINTIIHEYPSSTQGSPKRFWVAETVAAVILLANA